MPSWSSYSSKNSPDNTDTLMIKDNVETGNPNKQLSFSNLWNWVMSKTYAFAHGTKTIPAAINDKVNASDVGDLTDLETTDKSSIVDAINEINIDKVNISQGTTHSGKALVVNASGNVEPVDVLASIREETQLHPYGIEPFQLSLFKHTENLFSDFCYHITRGYYRGRTASSPVGRPRITATPNWQGWLIRVKPNTTYTLGPLDFKLELIDGEFNPDITISDISDSEPNTITTGENSLWMCLTQRSSKDMSGWMMVEGDTYPSAYVSGHPQWVENPKDAVLGKSFYTLFYSALPIEITFNGSSAVISIPNGRVLTRSGASAVLSSTTTNSFSTPKWLSYDMTAGQWVLDDYVTDSELWTIGFVEPSTKTVHFNARYVTRNTKTIAFMGDSITAGVAAGKCYHQFLHDRYGWTCLNYGYGGAGYYRSYTGTSAGKMGTGAEGMGVAITSANAFQPNNIVARLAEVNASTTDGIVIFAGTNDWGNNVSVEDFISGIESAFEYCKTNFTSIPVLVMTPIHRKNDTTPNSVGKTLREYADIIIEKCKKYSMPYVDTMTTTGMYPDNDANCALFFPDNLTSGLHPGIEGHKRIANAIGSTLKDLLDCNDFG